MIGLRIFPALATVIALAFAIQASIVPASANPLKRELWQTRPILIFAPSSGHSQLVKQRKIVKNRRTNLRQRDHVVYEIIGNRVTRRGNSVKISASSLRSRYGVNKNQFRLILVGKDGGEKRRLTKANSLQAIFCQVDRMPMRRREMRERGHRSAC